MLPSPRDRPLTRSVSEGIYGERFYQKHWDKRLPTGLRFDRKCRFATTRTRSQAYIVANICRRCCGSDKLNAECHVWHSRTGRRSTVADQSAAIRPHGMRSRTSVLKLSRLPPVFDIAPTFTRQEAKGAEPGSNARGFAVGGECGLVASLLRQCPSMRRKTLRQDRPACLRAVDRRWTLMRPGTSARTVRAASAPGPHPREITLEWAIENRTDRYSYRYNMNFWQDAECCLLPPWPAPGSGSRCAAWEELNPEVMTSQSPMCCPVAKDR